MGPFAIACALAIAGQAPEGMRPATIGAFTFEQTPARIVLGETAAATITLRARDAAGKPIDIADPRVAVSVGALEQPQRTGPGVWTVRYLPPGDGPPQIAVVVVALEGPREDILGVHTVALWGSGETLVKTKPGSQVTVRAAEMDFGPVTADGEGNARVPLSLMPGIKSATAISLDEAGNRTEKPLNLGVPPFNRLALLPLDEATVGDGTGLARLVAVTVDEAGRPTAKGRLTAHASVGAVQESAAWAPGLRALVLRPGKTQNTSVELAVELEGASGSRARATVQLAAGRATRARVELSRTSLREDDADRSVHCTVQLVDAAGRAVPPQGAGIAVDLGRLTDLRRDSDGTRHVTWLLPAGSQRERALLSVHLPSGETLASSTVTLEPAAVTAPLVVAAAPPAAAPPRPWLLVGGGPLLGSNYAELVSAGAELSAHARLTVWSAPLYLGGSLGFLQSVASPSTVAEHRAFPLLAEVLWRPAIAADGPQLLLGASVGPALSDLVRNKGGEHTWAPLVAAQGVIGVGFGLGPGTLDAYARVGTALYPLGGGVTEAAVGLPLGASAVLAYRFGLW